MQSPDFSDYDYSQDDEYDGLENQDIWEEDEAKELTYQEQLKRRLDELGY